MPEMKGEGSMKRLSVGKTGMLIVTLFLLVMPAVLHAAAEPEKAITPPIGQPLVREGDLAVKLLSALALGSTVDEAEAESLLGEAGIAPRNGWIADYPVTPDIVGELQGSVREAASSGRLSLNRDEALQKLDGAIAEAGLAVKPYASGERYETRPADSEKYPNPTVINNYYYNQGPPVVTYYAPPPDYYYLYSWVPSPFWWSGFWFPGFFILNDFHRTIFINQRVVFVSNHFNDARIHRVFRVDPVARFRGRTFAGIGATGRSGFISTGVPRSDRTIFNAPRARAVPGARTVSPPPARGTRMAVPPSGRTVTPAPGGAVRAPSAGRTPRSTSGGEREQRR